MLTPQQLEALMFIHARTSESGCSPSFRDISDALGLHSTSGASRLVNALEERGFIRRLPRRARAIEVLRLPHDGRAVEVVSRQPLLSRERLLELSGGDASATPAEVAAMARMALAATGAIGTVEGGEGC